MKLQLLRFQYIFGLSQHHMSREKNFAAEATSVFKIVLGVKVQEYVNPRPVPDRGMRALSNTAVEFIFPNIRDKTFLKM